MNMKLSRCTWELTVRAEKRGCASSCPSVAICGGCPEGATRSQRGQSPVRFVWLETGPPTAAMSVLAELGHVGHHAAGLGIVQGLE